MSGVAAGAAIGALAGGGLTLAAVSVPAWRKPRLDDRLAPYLRDTPRPSRLLAHDRAHTPFPTLERILRPVLADASRLLDRVLGGAGGTRRRLEQAGRRMTVEEFRAEQVVWGAIGMLAGIAVSVLALATDPRRSPMGLALLTLAAAVGGVVARDRWLVREVQRREACMIAEFPTVAELIALAVAAGEGAVGALERVTRTSSGELAKELGFALADARAGATIVTALEGISRRTSLPALARFVDGIVIAVERGTPLAEVLRAQAVDVREGGKRALLDAGGKKEIAMMVPVVFLILPISVLFALFPGFFSLHLTVS